MKTRDMNTVATVTRTSIYTQVHTHSKSNRYFCGLDLERPD